MAARLFGARINFAIGAAKTLMTLGPLEVKRLYFMDGWCQYENLKHDKKWVHIVIYLSGSVSKLVVILLINHLIYQGVLPVHIFFYQFVYFSVYFIFFSLFPFKTGEGNPSDGLSIYEVLKYGKTAGPIN
ncbi:hypothetical protein [Bacillus sp. AK031]